jgi:hypothetical protein
MKQLPAGVIAREWRRIMKAAECILFLSTVSLVAEETKMRIPPLDLPDREVLTAYERAADQNVLAARNPTIFPGYWSVCADGVGHGYGNTYPALDGHQMADALLCLEQVADVKANWDYVRRFQRPTGQLPFAILPAKAGQMIGPATAQARVDDNGGLYSHWVPGDPLRALSYPTYIQNADIIFRRTQDRLWLETQLPSVNLAAEFLATLTTEEGAVKGAGYYVEMPTRIEFDGVTQCHAVDAFRRVAALNRVVGDEAKARRYDELAGRIERHFITRFWVKDHFAEYLDPVRGLISNHGLTDVDWAALAMGVATPEQQTILWPKLKDEKGFYYGGMPSGIATRPETYADWEFAYPRRLDLAAMGRVWYLEATARARMGDAQGLLDGLRKVSRTGRENGYYWNERYPPRGQDTGKAKYCEYPANLIRIVQRCLYGVDFRLDGSLVLAPTATPEFWKMGFGQTIAWRNRRLSYRMQQDRIAGTFSGDATQRLGVKQRSGTGPGELFATVDGRVVDPTREDGWVFITLPVSSAQQPCRFEITGLSGGRK